MFSRLWNASNIESKQSDSGESSPPVKQDVNSQGTDSPVGGLEMLESRMMLSASHHTKKVVTATAFSITPVVHAAVSSAASTTTAVTNDASSPTFGDTITFTATVTGTGTPSGVVNFFDGATKLGAGTSNGDGTWTYATATLSGGSHNVTATYVGDSSNATSTSSASAVSIAKAAPAITWADPADIVYGTALSSTQLNATAADAGGKSVAGTFVYSSASGAVLKAGSAQAITVTFTPTVAASYSTATATAHINVTAKALTVTGITAATKVYDSTTAATLVTKSATLVGFVTADKANLALGTSGSTAVFSGADVGTGLAVTVSGLSLTGSAASNYTLTQPTGITGAITAAPVIVHGLTVADKTYDGTTTATVDATSATLTGVQGSDTVTLDASNLHGTYAKAAVGTGIIISTSGLALTADNAQDYQVFNPNLLGNVTAKALTITGVVPLNKTYDGTTTATLGTGGAALVGVVSGDAGKVTPVLAKATGTISQAGVGSGLAVTIAGITLTGASATNYTITQPTGTARIFAKGLTVTGITAANKVYDSNATATLDSSKAALVGAVTADKSNVALGVGSIAGQFVTPNVGTGLSVAVSGLTLTGSAAGNYTLTQPIATANIAAKALTVTGVTASDKTYDGDTGATIDATSAALTGVVGSDASNLTIDSSNAVGTFASKNAGSGINVAVSGLALGGLAATNYTLSQPTVTASISTRTVSVSGVTANDKVYDGTTAATLDYTSADVSGILAADAATATVSTKNATAAFADADVANGVTVTVAGLTLTGTAAANYTVVQPTAPANITAKALTVSGITSADKVYDATATATLDTSHAALVGVVTADASAVTLDASSAAGAFADANVGTAKVVSISGLALTGDAAGNYTITAPTTTAKITPATITATNLVIASNKVYDGTTADSVTPNDSAGITGIIDADASNLTLGIPNGVTGTFVSATVGTGVSVKVTGPVLGGIAAGNYTLVITPVTANITAKALTVTGVTAANKVYDGTATAVVSAKAATLAGFIPADKANLTLGTGSVAGTFGSANVATGGTVTVTGLTLSGTAAANYTLTQPTATANITAAPVTVTGIVAADKVYNGSKTASLAADSAALGGVVSADSSAVTLVTAGAVGTFASANVGNNIGVAISSLTLSGDAAGNYAIVPPTTTAKITAKPLTVTGLSAAAKSYDGTTVATISGSATLSGVVDADHSNVSVVTSKETGTFSSANVGSSLTVNIAGLTLSGTAAANYTVTQPTATAEITAKAVTLTGVTAADKVYDGTTAAVLTTSKAALVGIVPADKANATLDAGSAAGAFADANTGTAKAVTVTGLALTGSAATNYSLTQPTATAKITAAPVSFTGIVLSDKVYNGNTAAVADYSSVAATGIISADASGITIDTSHAAASYAKPAVGTALPITITGIALTGDNASNYSIVNPTGTAKITAKPVTVVGFGVGNKVYDGTAAATSFTGSTSLSGVVSGDASTVTLVTSKAAGTFSQATVGSSLTVTVSGLTLSGAAATNYSITQPTATANITAKALTITGVTAANKVYDHTTVATLDNTKAALVGFVPADKSNVTIDSSSAAGTFASANVGTKLNVGVSGLTLAGSAAGNYTVSQPTTTANITAAPLTVTGITAADKTYNGKLTATLTTSGAALSGVATNDSGVTLVTSKATGTFASKNAGSAIKVAIAGLTLTGATASNYTLTQPTTTATISTKTVTITGVTAENKVYDATAVATLNFNAARVSGLLASDIPGVSMVSKAATGTFPSANVGNNQTVTISGVTLSGAAATNYTFAQPSAHASIKAKALTLTGATFHDKVYDGANTATMDSSKAALVGVVTADKSNVTLNISSVNAIFLGTNVGTGIPISVGGLGLSGSAAGNYTLIAPTGSAKITPAAVTVTGITAADKAFDGTTQASIDTTSAALAGVLDADTSNVTLDPSAAVGTFAAAAKGSGVTVTITGLTLTGTAAGDYIITNPTTTASIT